MLNQALEAVVSVKLLSIQVSELSTLVARVSTGGAVQQAQLWLTVDSRGLISGLRISPAVTGPTPATWAGVDAALRSVAPEVHLLVANVTSGSCQLVHSIDPTTAAPLGAAFKLYVLDALGNAVASGKVRCSSPPLACLPFSPTYMIGGTRRLSFPAYRRLKHVVTRCRFGHNLLLPHHLAWGYLRTPATLRLHPLIPFSPPLLQARKFCRPHGNRYRGHLPLPPLAPLTPSVTLPLLR